MQIFEVDTPISGILWERGYYILSTQTQDPMSDLYRRLETVGFPDAYVRANILPDWWEDDLAFEAENRRLVEMVISRTLKISLSSLVATQARLEPNKEQTARFRHWKDVEENKLFPSVVIARRVCELVVSSSDLPALRSPTAAELRDVILRTQQYVSLTPLVQHCWSIGIPIVHLKELPVGARRLAGLALMVGDRPCVALADSRKSPAWLAWPLAHEIGHIAHGHCLLQDTIDQKIDLADQDPQEKQANDFAKVLLYGREPLFRSPKIVTPAALASQAEALGREHQIHPACIVTSYGFNMGAYDVANAALKILGVARGGAAVVREALVDRLDRSRMTSTDWHFLARVTGLAEI